MILQIPDQTPCAFPFVFRGLAILAPEIALLAYEVSFAEDFQLISLIAKGLADSRCVRAWIQLKVEGGVGSLFTFGALCVQPGNQAIFAG